ncbi:MAG: hypothetical protein WCF27_12295, partial [Gaiellaceae bacterium]
RSGIRTHVPSSRYLRSVRRRDLAVHAQDTRPRRRVLVVVVIAVVLLPVAWLALQTLGGESSKQSTPTPAPWTS